MNYLALTNAELSLLRLLLTEQVADPHATAMLEQVPTGEIGRLDAIFEKVINLTTQSMLPGPQMDPEAERRFIEHAAQRPLATQYLILSQKAIIWMSVQGYLLLALRHPGLEARASQRYILDFLSHLNRRLIDCGVMTQEMMDLVIASEPQRTRELLAK